jgi:hypothetical protein
MVTKIKNKSKRAKIEERTLNFKGIDIWKYNFDRANKRVVNVTHKEFALTTLFEVVTGVTVDEGALTKAHTSKAVLEWAGRASDPKYQVAYGGPVGAANAAALDITLGTLRLLCQKGVGGVPACRVVGRASRDN